MSSFVNKSNSWRLILHPAAHGSWNMAVDEAILEAVCARIAPPTLRLYSWHPPCLSLGYAQSVNDVIKTELASRGWLLTRRPTGGKAILHTDELTYAVIAPLDEPHLAGNLLHSYQQLSRPLMTALRLLDLDPESKKNENITGGNRLTGPVCFEVPSHYEITVQGKKLIGSAQARRKDGLLQHGSFPLCGDLTRITLIFAYPDESARQKAARFLLSHAATAETLSSRTISWEEAAWAFLQAFQREFTIELVPGALTPQEEARAEQLVREKYNHPDWIDRL